MAFKILQCNVNHSWAAQDLMEQNMIEVGAGIGIVAEPIVIPSTSYWFGSGDGRAAIRWIPEILQRSCFMVKKGRHHVTVKCGDVYVTSCYVSPNVSVNAFLDFLEDLSDSLRNFVGKKVVCGDFNSKSSLWGSPATDARGEYVEEW